MVKGKVIVIVAPSGSGKSTLIRRLKENFPELVESVSYTTRSKRPTEENGEHYYFVSKDEFFRMKDNNEFIEWAEVHSNYYGTSKNFVQSRLDEGVNLLFDLDVQGADAFKNYFGDEAKVIFIAPPSFDELKKRLRTRGTEETGIINLRLENSKKEMLRKDDYDYCVVNDDLDRAYIELNRIVKKILQE